MSNHGLSGGELQVDDLTWREQEILTLLAERLTNREIADCLHLAESTVKDYVSNILSKLYVKNRREAVGRAKALGLLKRDRGTATRPTTNLPAESTQFVGRMNELADIKRHLAEIRLLTLTGPGGIGKTRLALRAAGEVAGDFKDGCFLVSLAPISSQDHIVQTIAEALKFPLATHEDPQHQLLRFLRKRQLLLIMDNFEHLLDGVGIVSQIIQFAPTVTILATSRERLSLQGETILTVSGMAYPDQGIEEDTFDYDAITLFVQSARKVRPGFEPSPDELKQITSICQIVQGMPLAIELAAAWLSILNVDEVSSELVKGLDILETEMRDAPARHRSIRSVFEHSWSLLDRSEQEIFMILSVFRGGFTRHAAQQVSGATLQQLAGFVNKSLLSLDPDSVRLEVHELLRQFAQERLRETLDVQAAGQEAHGIYFGEFMQRMWVDLRSRGQILALAEIEADIENVRSAWRYYLGQRNVSQLWKFVNGLWYLYWVRWWNHAGMDLFAEAAKALEAEKGNEPSALWALTIAYQGYFMVWLNLSDQGYELTQKSIAILKERDHPEALVLAYDCLVVNAYFLNRYAEEDEAASQMLKISSELDDKWLYAYSLFAASMSALVLEDYQRAVELAEINLQLFEEIEDRICSTLPLIVLGHSALARGDYEAASGYYLRCLRISQEIGFHYAIQTASKYLCKVALSMGNIAEAKKYLLQSLTITKEIGFVRDIVNLLYEFARLQVAHENPEKAVELLALVIQHPASDLHRMMDGRIRDSARDLLTEIERGLSPEVYASALARGQELDLEEVTNNLIG
jgi:predicted ATPase/DNA-binding CsgD family transcriptional regulator